MINEDLNISSEDKLIIESYKKGNKQSFNLIVLKYQKTVYRIVRRIMHDHDITNDIVQDLFIKLYDSLDKFRGESKLSTYIYRMAYNSSMNSLKKISKSNERSFRMDDISNKLIDENSDFSELYDDESNEKDLTKIFDNLPPKQKIVFMMRYYDNLSYEEISQITGTSIGGLKANYFHAIKNLQSHFKKSI